MQYNTALTVSYAYRELRIIDEIIIIIVSLVFSLLGC